MSLNNFIVLSNIISLVILIVMLFRLSDRNRTFVELIKRLRTLEQDYFDLLRKLHQALAEVEFLKKGK